MQFTKEKFIKAFSLIEISVVILIISILIAGISQGVDLYSDFKLSIAKTTTQNSIVSRIDNLALWLETTNDSSFLNKLNDGDKITEWRDSNPNKINKITLTPFGEDRKPIFKKNGIGSIPSILFDGSNDALSIKMDKFLESDYSIFMVFNSIKATSVALDRQVLFSTMNINNSDGSYSLGGIIFEIQQSEILRSFHRNNITGNNNDFSSIPAVIKYDNNYIMKYSRDYSNTQKMNLWLNGVKILDNKSATVFGHKPDLYFNVGALYNFGVRPFNGYISELIIYDTALSSSQLEKIEEYLKTKYSIKY